MRFSQANFTQANFCHLSNSRPTSLPSEIGRSFISLRFSKLRFSKLSLSLFFLLTLGLFLLPSMVAHAAGGEIHFYPRSTYASRMVGGKFQGSNDNTTYTDLYTISATPTDSAWTVVTLASDPSPYRYLRYLSPNGSYGNVAEVEFYSGTGSNAIKLNGLAFGTGSLSVYTLAVDGDVTSYLNGSSANGNYVGFDQQGSQLTLTSAGIAAGFAMSTVATGFPERASDTPYDTGPMGIVFPGTTMLVSDTAGNLRVFPTDTDNQVAGSTPPSVVPTATYGASQDWDLGMVGGVIYMATKGLNTIAQVSANGTFISTVATVPQATSIAAYPAAGSLAPGHLFVTSNQVSGKIYDVNPATNTATAWPQTLNMPDGITISADGTTLYVATTTDIFGYDIATKTQIWDYNATSGSTPLAQLDGLALGYGRLSHMIYTDTHDGNLWQIALPGGTVAAGTATLIASGGTRGDHVTVDTYGQGSLLIVQSDRIIRLKNFPPAACTPASLSSLTLSATTITSGTSATGTLTLTGAALTGGEAVSLSSTSAAVQVPYTVLVPAGATTATFPITTTGILGTASVLIKATYHDTTNSNTNSATVQTATLNLTSSMTGGGSGGSGSPHFCGPMDVVFVIDSTGSMGGTLSNIQLGMTNIISQIQSASGGDYRLGLIEFWNDIEVFDALAPSNNTSVTAHINAMTPSNGGGYPQASDVAVLTAVSALPASHWIPGGLLQGSNPPITNPTQAISSPKTALQTGDFSGGWRPGALKIIILVTDALPSEFNNSSLQASASATYADYVAQQAQAAGVIICPINVANPESNISAVMMDYAATTGGVYAYCPSGTGAGTALVNIISQCGNVRGSAPTFSIFTRDDLPHTTTATGTTLTHSYSSFGISGSGLVGNSAENAAFNLAGIDGSVTASQMQRAGQISHDNNNGYYDLQWGITSLATQQPPASFGPVQVSADALPSPSYYFTTSPFSFSPTTWTLPQAFNTDIQQTWSSESINDQTGGIYNVTLTDQISSVCGSPNLGDVPHYNWPQQKNILTFMDMPVGGLPEIDQGRCLDISLPIASTPSYSYPGYWEILLNGKLVASSGVPNGWNVEADQTSFGGITVTVPTSATTSDYYQVNYVAGLAQSGFFGVTFAGTSSRTAILLPLVLSQSTVVAPGSVTGTVSLDAPAPRGGATVTLTSSTGASVPASILIPQNQTSATFTLTSQSVVSATSVQITASYNGYRAALLGVLPAGSGGGGGPGGPGTPPAPVSLTASGGDGVVTLNWGSSAGATSYSIFRSVTKGGGYALLFVGFGQTTYKDYAVTNGVTYYYVTVANNLYGSSIYSNEASATPLGGQVATPTITASGTSTNGVYPAPLSVTISDSTFGATIGYTVDGTSPTSGSLASGVIISLPVGTTTVTAVGYKTGYKPSAPATATFVVKSASVPTLHAITCGGSVSGTLTTSSASSQARGAGFYADYYAFAGNAGDIKTITMSSNAFDTYLVLRDPSGNVVATNDDAPAGTTSSTWTSQIVYTLLTSGTYTVEATSFASGAIGAYTLSLACTSAAPQLTVTSNGTVIPYAATPTSPAPIGPALSYGTTPIGVPVSKTFQLQNTGTAPLTLSGVTFPTGFTVTSPLTSPIAAGGSEPFVLRFDAAQSVSLANVTFTTNDPQYAAGTTTPSYYFAVQGSINSTGSSTHPKVPQGGSNTFPLNYAVTGLPAGGWYIQDPSGKIVGTNDPNYGSTTTGWTVALAADNTTVTVGAPSSAPVLTGYNVYVTQGTPYNATTFDVVASVVPAAPLSLMATAGNAQVQLTWASTLNAVTYNLYRGTTAGGEATTAIKTGLTGTSYTDPSLTNGTTYYYKLTAVDSVGEGAKSNEASATPQALVTPVLAATAGTGVVNLSWGSISGATSYNVYRGTSVGGENLTTPLATGVTGTTYADSAVSNGTPYYYKIKALGSGGAVSNYSNEASATPQAQAGPTLLTAVPGNAQVTLTWSSVTGAQVYQLYYSLTSGGPYSYANTTGATSITFTGPPTLTSLTNGTTYYFVVFATTSSGSTRYSNELGATPSLPLNLAAQPGNAFIKLTWSPAWTTATNPPTYNLYRGTTAGGEAATAVQTGLAGTSYNDTGLTNGTTYYYKLTAVSSTGNETTKSNEASATPAAVPATPLNLVATAGNARVGLTWNSVTGATSYNVKRSAAHGGPYTTISTAGTVTSNTYTDTTAINGTTYYYVVTAVNASGESPSSNEASATPIALPGTPLNLSAVGGNAQVQLLWSASASAASYTIYRGTTAGGENLTTPLGQSLTTAFTDTSAVNGMTYYYVVKAVNATGSSASSNEASATPQQGITVTPTITASYATGPLAGSVIPNNGKFNLPSGTTAKITLQSATPGAVLYYTLGTPAAPPADPTTSSAQYTAALSLTGSTVIKALATAIPAGYSNSLVATGTYTLNTPPTVTLSSPNGASFHTGDNVPLLATATDTAGGSIAQVQFLASPAGSPTTQYLVGTATTSPFQITWANVPQGTYNLTAVATDNDGGTATSSPALSITIGNPLTVVTIACNQIFSGNLKTSDGASMLPGFSNHFADQYTFTGVANQTVTLSLNSSAFDTYLALKDPSGTVLLTNDDSNGTHNSQIVYTLPPTIPGNGIYTIEVTSAASGAAGAYTLEMDCASASATPSIAVSVGSGGTSQAVANNGTVDFGATPLGVPITKTFTITNTGTADLNLTSLGGSSTVFAATTSPSSPIPAGLSTTFAVRFNPTANGAQTAAITLGNNTTINPFTINLTGTGGTGTPITVSSLTLSPTSVAGGSQSIGTVTLSAAAPAGGQSVNLASSSSAAPVPASVVVQQGKQTATFTITTTAVIGTASITAGTPGQTPLKSATLTITSPGTAPTISLAASPTTAAAPATITLTATSAAQTSGATIAKVEFFQGTTKIGEDTTGPSPYVLLWKNVPAGTYSNLTAKVTDSNGLATTSSAAATVTVTSGPVVTTPIISPAAGSYVGSVRVSISDTQTGAVILYTTDGSAPSPSPTSTSKVYRLPVLLTPGPAVTVKAQAFAPGYNPSAVAVANYTVTAGASATPSAQITSPADGTELTGPKVITGQITSGTVNWEMYYQAVGDTAWTAFASGTQGGTVTGTLDTTLLLNGQYQVLLTAVDANGNIAQDQIGVVIKGDQKVGYFTLSYTDMTIPIAGIPISITRTYDSRDKSKGDFGVGWTLSTSQIKFQKPEVSGFDWDEVEIGGGLGTYYQLQAVRPHLLTFTLPNGDVYNFSETLSPSWSPYAPLASTDFHYQQISGRPATLVPVDQNPTDVLIAPVIRDTDPNIGSSNAVDFYEDADLNELYDPQQFQLTLANGTKIVVDKVAGLKSITDLSGNTVTFSATDIQNIAGTQDIKISRTNGLITSITDLNHNPFSYTQDASGNLASAKDRNGNTTTYDYDAQHNVIAIHAADGTLPLANYYYPDGRLNYSLDANGNKVSYNYPPNLEAGGTAPSNSQITIDQLGNKMQMTYDSYGNVTAWTKYLGTRAITTSYTFKAGDATNPDKPTSMTDPYLRVTNFGYDSSGNLTSVSQNHTDANNVTTTLKVTSTYNAFGEVLTTQNPNQQGTNLYEITNVYDPAGRLTSTTDALGSTTTCTYNPAGTLSSLSIPSSPGAANYSYQYTYDAQGNVHTTTGPTGTTTSYTYDNNGKVLTESVVCTLQPTATSPQSAQTIALQFGYDLNGNQTSVVGPDNASTAVYYNSLNQVDHTVDAAGRTTHFTYDAMGRQSLVSYPGGGFSQTAYDAAGNVQLASSATGRISGFAYDSLYRLVQSGPVNATTPLVSGQPNWLLDANNKPFTTSTTYNDDNTVASRTDASGNVSKTTYDDLGRPLVSTDAFLAPTSYSYDALGKVLSVTDANKHTTQFTYDNDSRGTGSVYPDNTSNVITYDARGREIAVQDQDGRITQYTYDAFGHILTVTTPMSEVTKFAYDEVGNKISQTDANGHTTYFAYDIAGQLIQKTLPLGQYETMTYNPDSTLATMTDYNGHTTTFGYDAAGRQKTVSHDDGTGVTTIYNTDGTVHQMTRTVAGGGTVITTYAYDPNHPWLTSVQTVYGSISNTVSYGYDLNGRLAFIQSPSGKTQYTYDPDSRLQTVKSPDGAITKYAYDKVGNRYQLLLPNGVTTTYGYDSLNRLKSLTNTAGPSYTYLLDLNGQRLSMTDSVAGTTTYGYDKDGRLTLETFPNHATSAYTYDLAGNRTSLNGVTWTYDNNDRLTNAGSTTYTYDNNGNVRTSGGATCTYDAENHLLTTGTSGLASSYLYDAAGNRVKAVVGSTTTNFVVDSQQSYPSVLEERDASNALVAHYDYGADRIRMDRGGAYYYVYDGLGSVRALTNSTGSVTDTYAYDAFGNTSHGLGSSPNPYQFNGQALDASGLYFLRARYYNPGDGRFLSQDPLSGSESDPASLHRYLYASGDPVNRMDPGGMEDFSLGGVMASVGIATTLGGIIDAAEFAIKDQFAAAAGVDISQEKVIALTITSSAGLGNDWTAPIEQSIQNLEIALFIFQVGSHIADLTKAVMKVHGDPPFSKFAGALSSKDNSLAEFADDEDSLTSQEREAVSSGNGCNLCLVAGSEIEMADGTVKAIEKLQPHDQVLSRNPETGEIEPKYVTQTISRKTAVLMTLTFTDLKTGKVAEAMTCTPDHPVFVQGKGWVPAGMLIQGDVVVTRDGTSLAVGLITWQRDEKHGFTVYNLTIEDNHTYFVGVVYGGIWVHNCPGSGDDLGPGVSTTSNGDRIVTTARNLTEQIVLKEALADGGKVVPLSGGIGDPAFQAPGWAKHEYVHPSPDPTQKDKQVVVHWFQNSLTGEIKQLKIKLDVGTQK